MNEKELKVAIDQLTAMSDFALDLKGKLEKMLESGTDVSAVVPASQLVTIPDDVAEEVAEEQDLDAIISEYDLNSMTAKDLKEYLDDNEVEYTAKAKKDLVKVLAQAIADGLIDTGDEEAEDTSEVVETPVADEAEADQADDGDFEASDERVEAENTVEDKIRASFGKKLKISTIKKFLKTYYDGDAEELETIDEGEDDVLLEMYIDIQKALVDDEGDVHDMEEAYYRNGVAFCCGKELVEMEDSDNMYCEICGNEYEF